MSERLQNKIMYLHKYVGSELKAFKYKNAPSFQMKMHFYFEYGIYVPDTLFWFNYNSNYSFLFSALCSAILVYSSNLCLFGESVKPRNLRSLFASL